MAFHEEMESEFDFSITRYLTYNTHEMLGRNLSSLRSLRLETNYTVNSYLFKVSQVSKRKICACLFYFLQLKLVVVTMYTFINSASTCMYLLLKYNGGRKGGGWNSREEISRTNSRGTEEGGWLSFSNYENYSIKNICVYMKSKIKTKVTSTQNLQHFTMINRRLFTPFL